MKFLAAYLVAAVLAYGIYLGDFEGQYPDASSCRRHAARGALFALGGPISLLVGLGMSGFAEHGLKFSCGGDT